jgi:hypothetical protein
MGNFNLPAPGQVGPGQSVQGAREGGYGVPNTVILFHFSDSWGTACKHGPLGWLKWWWRFAVRCGLDLLSSSDTFAVCCLLHLSHICWHAPEERDSQMMATTPALDQEICSVASFSGFFLLLLTLGASELGRRMSIRT